MLPILALNSLAEDSLKVFSSCLYLPTARIIEVYHHAWFMRCRGLNPGPHAYWVSSLLTDLYPWPFLFSADDSSDL